jgi:hypothetical protein
MAALLLGSEFTGSYRCFTCFESLSIHVLWCNPAAGDTLLGHHDHGSQLAIALVAALRGLSC